MSENTHPFLRIEIFKFQVSPHRQTINLRELKTEVEIKEKNGSNQSCTILISIFSRIFLFSFQLARIKKPVYNESNRSIRFDAGLFANIERQILIRIIANENLYTFQSDLKLFHKLADGARHQVIDFLIFN